MLTAAGLLAALIAWLDWVVPNSSLGFLYVIPILLASPCLSIPQVLVVSVVCSLLRELFRTLPFGPAAGFRLITGFAGFLLAGGMFSQLTREHRLVIRHWKLREEQMRLRQDAEQQIRVLIETSPLAILTLNAQGHILLANRSAHAVFGFADQSMQGADVSVLLPILTRLIKTRWPGNELRTTLECKAQRLAGETFLAHVWLSTYETTSGRRLAAAVWDGSQNLRDREGTFLESMMSVSRVLIGAVSHEIRNLAAAADAAYQRLGEQPDLGAAEPYQALGTMLRGIEKIASAGLREASKPTAASADLSIVLDETRIVIEDSLREKGGAIRWKVPASLPLVQADHHSLVQVFLNLVRNSESALEDSPRKELEVEAYAEGDVVLVKIRDTGPGVARPEELFRPFQAGANSTGLGLYVSRAILRSGGGDLRYEPQPEGSCFVVELWPVEDRPEI